MFGLNPGVLLVALGLYVMSVTGAFFYGSNVGADGERVEWQARENKELSAANAKITELTEKARAKEAEHGINLAAISGRYQEELEYAKREKDRVIADVRAGARRLRIPVAACSPASGSASSPAAAPAERRDGEARAELSDAAADFLVGLASEADAVARQLAACQAVIMQDRK